jgi:hypothetical protein
MHVTAVLDGIKKRGHFQDNKKAEKVHEEAKKAVESAGAALSRLDGTGTKAKRFCKKNVGTLENGYLCKVPLPCVCVSGLRFRGGVL